MLMLLEEPKKNKPIMDPSAYFEKFLQVKNGKITHEELIAYCKEVLAEFSEKVNSKKAK